MIRQMLFTGWDLMRSLRLVMGIIIAMQAVQSGDVMLGFLSVFFLFQAVTNTGCCGSNGCSVPLNKSSVDKNEDVDYEEVKSK